MTKKSIFIVLVTLCLSAGIEAHSWTKQSVLADGHWVKIEVSESGVYKMSSADLRNAGLNIDRLRIYGYGGAQLSMKFADRMIDDLCPVAYYRGTDYVLFYAQGINRWSYTGSRFSHERNTYSEHGYYFLSDDAGEQLLLNDAPAYVEATAEDVYTYTQLHVFEEEIYNLVDISGAAGGGRHWYGTRLTRYSNTQTASLPTHDLTGEPVRAQIRVGTKSSTQTKVTASLGESSVSVNVAGITDIYNRAYNSNLTLACAPVGTGKQSIKITTALPNDADYSYPDYIELAAPAHLKMASGYLPIQTAAGWRSATPLRYHLTNATDRTMVWDVTSLDSIRSIGTQLTGDTLLWTGSNRTDIRYYVAVNPAGSGFRSPTVIGRIANQNLHALDNIELVIITPEEFKTQANRIADIHRDKDGDSVAVVTDRAVYNEFSSGTPDATAYRRLMKMLYDRSTVKPRWLLLFGDGSFDNRGLLSTSGNHNLLTYQADNSTNEVSAYTCDGYFGWLDDNSYLDDPGNEMQIGVGRLPVSTIGQADNMVAKIETYYTDSIQVGAWHQRLIFMADDGDYGRHLQGIEQGAKLLMQKVPQYNLEKIYLSAEVQQSGATGESYPAAQSRLHNMLADGTLVFDYCGHGSANNITSENIITKRMVEDMVNAHMGLWIMATCSFSHWDGREESIGESAILNPSGAAIAVFAAARTVYENQNETLNKYLLDTLFQVGKTRHEMPTIGDAIRYAKNNYAYDSNKLAYNLLGDPAIRLAYPQDYRAVTIERPDTMRALSMNTIVGQIVDESGSRVKDFNGSVLVTVYDKIQTIKTLDNDGKSDTLKFQTYPNRLFSGRAAVEDGLFDVSFKLGKDIRYDFGNSRIVYYAMDSTYMDEAIGYDLSATIGGSSKDSIYDPFGPDIDMYLNAPAFRSGSKTTSTPRLYIRLYDENGINTSGAAIGHDIQLTIDDDPNQIYILNDYYVADEGSYESGRIEYLLGPLSEGYHTIRLRAWDLLNNSSTEILDLTVVEDLDPQIYQATITPGNLHPDKGFAVSIQHDRPDEAIDVTIQLFDIRGMLVYEQHAPYSPTIACPAAGLSHGLYIYRISIQTKNSNDTSVSGKIICL